MKIPNQAKKVFNGVIFDVYQWPQEMFDGSHETFEMIKRPNTVEIIATVDDKIVLLYEEQPAAPPRYGVIGGRMDKTGESPLECAKRELLEETGMISEDWELCEQIEPYVKMEWIVYRFIARNCKKITEPNLDSGEKIDIKQLDFDDFVDIITDKNFRSSDLSLDILRMYYKNELDEFKQKLFGK